MLTPEENQLLCRVEGDAPMGQIMRRHWLPACLSEEIPTSDCDPVPIRLLGEDLVAWRDSEGAVGVMDRYCPHRRASLQFGRNEDCGLRCLYHGWKVNVLGDVIEMPSEPAGACSHDDGSPKVRHKAYATHEHAGFVWVYMGVRLGSGHSVPAFTPPAWAPHAHSKVSVAKIAIDCNWAQILEGAIDSAHSSSLHSTDMTPAKVDSAKATAQVWLRPSTDRAPKFSVQPTDYGFKYAAIRRPITNAATNDYVRISVFVAPSTVLIPPNNLYNVANINVPIDDTHTMFHFIAWTADGTGGIDSEEWRKFCAAQVGIDVDKAFNKVRMLSNRYLQDRASMKIGSFTGIRGIPNQDIAMWETMGPIADRTHDRLGASDQAIVEFRRIMLAAAHEVAKTGNVIGEHAYARYEQGVRSFEGVVPKTTDWRTLGVPAAAANLAAPAGQAATV